MNALDVYWRSDEVVASDVIVVGSGVAGLSAALGPGGGGPRHRPAGDALDQDRPRRRLQPVGPGRRRRRSRRRRLAALWHARDTVEAGAGLGERAVIDVLTREGPDRIRRLIELGGDFDRGPGGELSLGREGAYSRRRILHADGDATGREMVRALRAAVRERVAITVHEGAFALDLVMAGERVAGVLARHPGGRTVFHRAAAVVLATGGFGQLYERTTNPLEATGDGLAMAAQAGAALADLEMVQFHPTALAAAEDPSPLVTEALHGQGALLINDRGERFMVAIDRRAELAPRDLVARAILDQLRAGRTVFLDATQAVGERFPRRFPTIWEHCGRHRIDPRRQPIPVSPAAHYAMAGVAVDESGRGSLSGLWACGEVTSSGIHGTNRLASNSLLEALVFGALVADDIAGKMPAAALGPAGSEAVWREPVLRQPVEEAGTIEQPRRRLRRLIREKVGLLSDGLGLEQTLEEIDRLSSGRSAEEDPTRAAETRNLLTVGRLVTAAALAREESRGAHYRSDFPHADERLARRFFWTYEPAPGSFPLAERRDLAALAAREIA